ncbi:DUF4339 domain-containing protein, partial [Bacteriovoracaceae bacterium]|nr:DUF4339 domain-containing protein [Bacteriovoracaceae bacterium]
MSWYYVEDADRKGPVDRSEIETLIKVNTIGAEDFIWSKGLDDWVKASEVEQFSHCFNSVSDAANIEAPPVVAFNFSDYSSSQKLFFIRVGLDRGGVATDYGPFSLNTLKKLYKENRVNAKTLVYTKGIPSWTLLSNAKDFEVVFEEVPPVLGEVEEITDKREFTRKPFVARMFFQNNQEVYEGI